MRDDNGFGAITPNDDSNAEEAEETRGKRRDVPLSPLSLNSMTNIGNMIFILLVGAFSAEGL